MKKVILIFLCVCAVILITISCSMTVTGGSSSTDNGKVIGMIQMENGQPASQTQVILLPADYNPFADTVGICYDTTNAQGVYGFKDISPGTYNVQAIHLYQRIKAVITGIEVDEDIVVAEPDTLKNNGAIKVFLPDSVDPVNGYVYIPGTTIAKPLSGDTVSGIMDSVPAGLIPSVYYATVSGTLLQPIRYDITVIPNKVATITMPTWKYSKQLYLNTSSSGARVSSNVFDFPVLVRLSAANFNFLEAKAGGEDIRFTKPDNTMLPYEIEYWNAEEQEAAIWVKADTVYGNNNTQHIIMVWGKSVNASASNSAAVFDTATGFQGVWHLAEKGTHIVSDATYNNFDGIKKNITDAMCLPGMIGNAQEFDGTSSFIEMPGTASGKLDFPEDGIYSVSAWAYTDTLDSTFQIIASKGDFQYNLQVMFIDNWEFAEYQDLTGWEYTSSPAIKRTWAYVVGIRKGNQQYLYVNGRCTDSSITLHPDTLPRITSFNFMLGKKVDEPIYFFDGKIDEVRVSNVALSADWIKLTYMNQKADNALVEFK